MPYFYTGCQLPPENCCLSGVFIFFTVVTKQVLSGRGETLIELRSIYFDRSIEIALEVRDSSAESI